MPVRDLADDLDQTTYTHPVAEIWLAESLQQFTNGTGGTVQKHLYLKSLTLRASPDIDTAELEFRTGVQVFTDDDQFTANSLLASHVRGKAIKIKIADTVTTVEEDKKHIIWFGIVDGNVIDGVSQGTLSFTASGVLILAAQHYIHSSFVQQQYLDQAIELGIGLGFNVEDEDEFNVQGNRAPSLLSGDPAYVFSYEQRGFEEWTSHTAVEYLLKNHSPSASEGVYAPLWEMHPDTLETKPAKFYRPHVATDGRSLKEILDDLLPRKRALSYYAEYDDTLSKIILKVFTFVAEDIELPTMDEDSDEPERVVILANPDQVISTLRDSIWVYGSKLTESSEQEYDAVVGYGARLTSTCTLWVGLTYDFRAEWNSDEEDAYKTAVSTTDTAANARYRSEDRQSLVYMRFYLDHLWLGMSRSEPAEDGDFFWVFPSLNPASGVPYQPYVESETDPKKRGMPLRVCGLKLLRKLPLYERIDYSEDRIELGYHIDQMVDLKETFREPTPEEIPPFFYVDVNGGVGDPAYCLLEKLSTATEGGAANKRKWSVSVSLASNFPAVEFRVTGGRQTLLAKEDFLTPPPTGAYDSLWDPESQNGIDFNQIEGTVCIEAEHRLTYRETMVPAVEGRPERILYIHAPKYRRDYVVPDTVVAIVDSAKVLSTGGYVRDDYDRLKTVVKAAAEWYRRVRRSLMFSYKQVRRIVEVGTLITRSYSMQLTDQINTPITSITYNMGDGNSGGSTTIETGFAELDFS